MPERKQKTSDVAESGRNKNKKETDEHDESWHKENKRLIDEEDAEIRRLERKLGFGKDTKRRERNNTQTDMEGFGRGFMSFIDSIERKAKNFDYKPPSDDYDFNKPEFEVAISEGQLEEGIGADQSAAAEDFEDFQFDEDSLDESEEGEMELSEEFE